MVHTRESLLIFEEQLDLIREKLKTNVIRMADSKDKPHDPLRPNREVTYDPTGNFVLPNSATGISLAASLRQLEKFYRPKTKKWFLLVDRRCPMPEGFRLQPDSAHHWSIVVTRKMAVKEFNGKISELIRNWEVLGRFVRYE